MLTHAIRTETERRFLSMAAVPATQLPGRFTAFLNWGGKRNDRYPVVLLHMTAAVWALAPAVAQRPDDTSEMSTHMPAIGRAAWTALTDTQDRGGDYHDFVDQLLRDFERTRDPLHHSLQGVTVLALAMRLAANSWPLYR